MADRHRIPESLPAPAETPATAAAVDEELPLLMVRALKAMVAEVAAQDDTPNTSGLTAMHGIAVRYIAERSDVTTVELAAHLRVTKQSASEIVGALEREGYVERRPHPLDGRARVVELTTSGRAGLVRSRARWTLLVRDLEQLVGSAEVATVRRVFEAFLEAHPYRP